MLVTLLVVGEVLLVGFVAWWSASRLSPPSRAEIANNGPELVQRGASGRRTGAADSMLRP